MARTISTKLAVEGETQYKQAIAACNSELSTLKSSLALVESEFRGNANSMEALTAKGAAFESMYKKQQDKVSTLEAALRNAQKAQDEYASRVSTAKENIERCEKALETLRKSTGDTTAEQEELTKELGRWKDKLEEAENGQKAAERGVQNWQKQLNNAKVELNDLSDEIDKNKGYLDEAGNSADGCAKSIDEYGKEVKEAGEESEDFGEKSKKGIEELAAALAAAGIAKTAKEIADALIECADAAAGFETSMAKVSTLVDTTKVPLETIKGKLLELSGETGIAVGDLSEAAYQALSAGVDTADVVNFVATATKTATAGFTDSSTAVDVLTTALNAYKLEGTETERVASMLVKTQDEGKTSVGELAANMGRVIPSAAAYNVSLGNLTTAYALLTKGGMNTAISTTNLGAMMDELAKKGSTVSDILNEKTGKSFAELMGSGANLGDVMAILSDSVNGDATAFSNLWSSSTAGKAALALLNSGTEEFSNTLAKMENSSGAVEKNFKTMADTTEFAQKRMTNAADNLKIAIGDQLNPALKNLYSTGADAFSWATDFVKENPWIVNAITGVTAALAALSLGVGALAVGPQIIMALKTAIDLLAANPMVAVAAAIAGVIIAFETYNASIKPSNEETKEFLKSLKETKTAFEELSDAMKTEQDSTAASMEALENLLAVEKKSEAQKKNIKQLVDELNEAVPDLGLAYDETSDKINMTTEALAGMIEKSAEQEEMEAQVARLTELRKEEAKIARELEQAQTNYNAAMENAQYDSFGMAMNDAARKADQLYTNVRELTTAQGENKDQIAELEKGTTGYKVAMDEIANRIAEVKTATEKYTDANGGSITKTEEAASAMEDMATKMEELQAAYEESYNAAMESIDKQLGLFNELDGTAKTSIGNLIETLKGQVSYMETYADNIQKAMELGVDEGLVRKLSDGSEESAQILAAIVEGGTEDIDALNEQFAKVEDGKEAFSETVAEMETDFANKMEDLVRDLDDAIKDMDLSDDTYIIGENNIQGLIDGTASKRAELVSKYAEMGRAAVEAYRREVEQASPSKKFKRMGQYDIQGIIQGAEMEKENLAKTYADAGRKALSAMERSLPRSVEEPPASAALNSQTAAIMSAIQSNGAGGGVTIYIDRMEVREDSDVERVARELYFLEQRERRSRGGGSL